MRKLFLSIVAAAALITSCSKDDTTSAPINQRSKVTFAVNAPELATRADEGEGLQAKNLEYVIYDLAEDTSVEANLITGKTTFPDGSLSTTVEVDLVEGRTYEAIFFATADNAPYTFNKTAKTMTINTEKLMANQESYDAFYKYVEPFTIEATAKEMDVEMTRPFAQLNVATDDFDKDGGKLIDANTTGIEVTAYTTLDFKSGDVDGKKTIVYGLSNKMDGTIKANTKDYDWLTMNYLLVNARELVDVKFVFTDEPNNKADNPLTRNYGSVPVERNYRTNIVGSILTNPTKFDVEILPGFEDDADDKDPSEVWDGKTYDEIAAGTDGWYSVSHAAEFAYLLTLDRDLKIRLEADINFGGHQIPEWGIGGTGKYVALEGNGNKILNYKNVTTTTKSATNENAGLFEYVHGAKVSNLTIENAEVDAGNASDKAFAGALFGTTFGTVEISNVTIKNSKVSGVNKVGGLIGFAASDGTTLIIDNVHVINPTITTHKMDKESGSAGGFIGIINKISSNYTAVIKNSSVVGGTFNVDNGEDAAKRANSQFIGTINSGNIELVNCSVDTTDLSWNETGVNNYTSPYGELIGGNRGTATVVIDGNEFKVETTGKITVETEDGETATVVTTSDNLVEALESDENVFFTSDVKIDPAGMSNAYGTTGINVKNGQTIDGNGHVLDIKGAGGTWDSGINTTGGTIKNITVTGSFRGIFINHNSTHSEKVILENVITDGTVYTISCDQGTNQGLEATGCTFNGWTSFAATLGNAKFTNCTFSEGSGYAYCRPYAPTEFVGCEFEAGFELDARAAVTFENCTLDGKPLTAENLATLVTSNTANASVK